MRTLPDNPSLEFLKREAKDVLAGLRESTEDASLSDAQRSLAEQYGFRTWTDLKTEVDRRRASVVPGSALLAGDLAAAFGLGDVAGPLMPIANEPMGRTWLLTTARGRFVASPLYTWVNDAQAAEGVRLMEAAHAAGLPTPRPVRSAAGRLVEQVDGRSWRVDEAMDLGPSPARPVRSSVARAVGRALATIHGLGLPTDRVVTPYLTMRHSRDEWDGLVSRARQSGVPWLADLEAALPVWLELSAAPSAQASDVILSHCNLIPDHVRTLQGGAIAVLHWDFSGAMVPAWELASTLVHWSILGAKHVNRVAARALVDGYRSRAGSVPTLDLSAFSVAISGYLNWTHAQICGAIESPSAEEHEFAKSESKTLMADPLSVATLEQFVAELELVPR